MQLSVGDRLAQYEIVGPLGAGGMGEVYRARDARLGREVALKILPSELASNDEALRRFEQEARAASALNHPNIVTIYDIGQTDGMAWIAMELIDGADLRTLAAREPLSLKAAVRIAVKISEGLAAAHDRGIVHRDLKPENVMVTTEGFVKILDFGLAKQARSISADESTLPHTTPGTVFGTVGYMSPEQAMGREMDHRSDQFSFAVLLYEVLAGRRPFDAPTKAETVAAIIRDDPKSLSEVNEAVPFELEKVLTRCLAKLPRDRYASTRDLARDLREIRDALTVEPARLRSGSGRQLAALKRQRVAGWTAGVALLVVLVSGGYAIWQRRADPAVVATRISSLAVTPFRDQTGTPDGRLLTDGLSELVGQHLSEVPQLRVAMLDREEPNLAALIRRTGAEALLRGEVQRRRDDLLVQWSIVDPAGRVLQSDRVRGSVLDLLGLEDAVAASLLRAVGPASPVAPQPRTSTLSVEAQKKFVEAYGLVRRARDEEALDTAIDSLQLLLRDYGDSAPINALLARALLHKSQLSARVALVEQATVYANRAISLDPDDPGAVVTLGVLQNASGRPEEAVKTFERAIQLRPQMGEAFAGLGDAFQKIGRGADAEAAYRKSIDLRPDQANAYIKYGTFCLMRGRNDEAVTLLARAAELMPDSSRTWLNLGSAYHASGRYDDALAAYARANQVEPSSAAFSNIGTIHFYRREYEESCKAFERATELAPWDYLMWANLGDAYRWTPGRQERALDAYARSIEQGEEALRINPSDAMTRGVLAVARAKRGDHRQAATDMQATLELAPTNPVVLYQAAVVAQLGGRRDTALSWLERAIASGYPAGDVAADPEFASLHQDPAFRKLVEKSEN